MRSQPLRLSRNLMPLLSLVVIFGVRTAAFCQDQFKDLFRVRSGPSSSNRLAEFQFDLSRGSAPDEAVLTITATIPPRHYIYSMTDGGAPTRLDIKQIDGLTPIDKLPQADHPPKVARDPILETTVEKYVEKVVWTQRYQVTPGASSTGATLSGQIVYQICDDSRCIPNQKAPFDLKLAAAPAVSEPVVPEDTAPAIAADADAPGGPEDPFGLGQLRRRGNKPVPEFTAHLTRENPGEAVLVISATIPRGFHIFSTGKNGEATTVIQVESLTGLEPLDSEFVADHRPEIIKNETSPEFAADEPATLEIYHDHVSWQRRYRVTAQNADEPGARGVVAYQICDENTCRPLQWAFSAGAGSTAATAGLVDRPGAAVEPSRLGGGVDRAQGLLVFLTAAALAGFAALLTPCVFPMIPITVSFFQKQSEKEHHRPVTMALVYCVGIIATFTALGVLMSALFGATALNTAANNPWLNLFIAGVLIFFAFNLLGLFEIRIPGWLLTYTATQEGRGGYIGVLFMALTFTLTSFTCTFAFAGALLGWAANGERLWPVLGLLAFSAAFSLPFFFLALFPSLLKKLPKSGGWMNVAKVIMGLIELGAAFKFLSVADLTWHPVAWIFDYELVLSAWMVISIGAGMYLLGMFRLPHDVPTEHVGVMRFMSAMTFLGLAGYLAVGLYSADKPTGKVWENILAFAPPKFNSSNEAFGPSIEHGGIKYALDYRRAIEYAAKQNKPVFIDFTGVNCANCRKMEKGPLSQPLITERLKGFVCVQVYADAIPVIADRSERARLLRENLKLQTWFGDASLPSYVVIPADPDVAAHDVEAEVLSATIGYSPDEALFAQFLDVGLSRWKQRIAKQNGDRVVGSR